MKTPVLLIIFNRPSTTRKLIEVLETVKPPIVYIAADGPRENKPEEKELCEETKKIALNLNWPCEIHTLFQQENLGCKQGPIAALNWFFDNVSEGIILEDDCIPNPSFFNFCETLLTLYKNDERIMHISGDNFQNNILRGDKVSSYYFSKYTHSWGWATWKRSWEKFNVAIEEFDRFDKEELIRKVEISRSSQDFWIKNFRQTIKNNDSWDSLWMYTVWYNNGLSIIPQQNLVSNIGFGEDATHTKNTNSCSLLKTHPLENIIFSKEIKLDKEADEYTFKKIFKVNKLFYPLYYLKKILLS